MKEEDHYIYKILGITVILFALIFVAYKIGFEKKDSDKRVVQQDVQQTQKNNVDFSEYPEKFPTYIPIESGAKVTQNFNATNSDGNFQSTRTFETQQTLAANLTLYTEYFKDNGWKIISTADEPNLKMVLAQKDEQTIQVTMNQNTVTKIKTVTISYSEIIPPKAK